MLLIQPLLLLTVPCTVFVGSKDAARRQSSDGSSIQYSTVLVGAAMAAVISNGCYNTCVMVGSYHGEETYRMPCAFVAAPQPRVLGCRSNGRGSRTAMLGQSQHSEQRAGFQPPSPLANDGHVVELSSVQDLFDSGEVAVVLSELWMFHEVGLLMTPTRTLHDTDSSSHQQPRCL